MTDKLTIEELENHRAGLKKQNEIFSPNSVFQSEEKWQNLLDISEASILVIDIAGKFLMINAKVASQFGLPKSEIIGKSIFDFFPPEVSNKQYEQNKLLIERGGSSEYEASYVLNGKMKTFSVVDQCLQDDNGHNYAILSSSIDITERKQADIALKASESQFKNMFEKHSSVMLLVEPESGKIINANLSASKFYGFTISDLCKKNIAEINMLPPDLVAAERRKAVEEKRNYFLFPHRLSSGEERSVEVHSSPIIYGEDKLLFSIVHDITERKKAEQALKESEEKFRYLIENMQIGVLIQGPNAEILLSNTKALELLGRTESQLLGKTYFDPDWNVIHEDGSPFPGTTHPVSQAIATRSSVRDIVMGVYRPSTDNYVWLLVNAEPQLNADGSVQQVVCLFIDISELKNAEIALKEREYELNDVQQKTGLGLWSYDPVSRQPKWSKEMFNIWGLDPIYGAPNYTSQKKYIHPDDFQTFDKLVKCALEKGEPFVFEKRICRPDNSERNVITICEPIKDSKGKVVKLRGTYQDITKSKQIELIIHQQNEVLKKLNTDKDLFISILGHDLRSPFNAILGFLNLLSENIKLYDIDEIEKIITIINNSAHNTFKLLEDILFWVRAHSGKIQFEPQILNLGTTCDEVIDNLIQTANRKDITINHDIVDEITVFADENMLKTVLRNLISNAIKFTNNKGHIDIHAEINQPNMKISVSDNGIGIAPQILSKLFDISQITKTIGTANEKGTGFGLLLCKEFVEKHDGKIWVESTKGNGSIFTFTVPIKI